MKIAIIGAGPSGLYLAILVKRRRLSWEVSVIEQNVADLTFGFGVVLADSGLARIQAAEPQVNEKLIAKMTFTGCQTINLKVRPVDINHPAKGGAIARIDLLHALQESAGDAGVDVRFGQRIEHPSELSRYSPGGCRCDRRRRRRQLGRAGGARRRLQHQPVIPHQSLCLVRHSEGI